MDAIQPTNNPPASRPTREATPASPTAAAEAPAAEPKPAAEDEAKAGTKPEQSFDVKESVDRLNNLIQSVRRELQFSVDEDSGRTVIKVIDSQTKEIVRQIPPEEVMTLVERLSHRPSLMADVEA